MYQGFKYELDLDLEWAVAEEWRGRLEVGWRGSGHPGLEEVWRLEVDRLSGFQINHGNDPKSWNLRSYHYIRDHFHIWEG